MGEAPVPAAGRQVLIHLYDEEQGVSVRVVEGVSLSASDRYDALRAEIVVTTGFVSGRVEVFLSAYDLDSWGDVLDAVAAGRSAVWLESGRSPRIMIDAATETESECLEVSVFDVTGSQALVVVPIADQPDWAAHRRLLATARDRYGWA
ncbi:DUF5959 family protein [Streptomyces sp. enrichment culture]|uniref:DUF5959 family protein n=1 Tax=Streptomyces sp. enrichment culture TaxID=1795815 RepID=UPI003F5551FA